MNIALCYLLIATLSHRVLCKKEKDPSLEKACREKGAKWPERGKLLFSPQFVLPKECTTYSNTLDIEIEPCTETCPTTTPCFPKSTCKIVDDVYNESLSTTPCEDTSEKRTDAEEETGEEEVADEGGDENEEEEVDGAFEEALHVIDLTCTDSLEVNTKSEGSLTSEGSIEITSDEFLPVATDVNIVPSDASREGNSEIEKSPVSTTEDISGSTSGEQSVVTSTTQAISTLGMNQSDDADESEDYSSTSTDESDDDSNPEMGTTPEITNGNDDTDSADDVDEDSNSRLMENEVELESSSVDSNSEDFEESDDLSNESSTGVTTTTAEEQSTSDEMEEREQSTEYNRSGVDISEKGNEEAFKKKKVNSFPPEETSTSMSIDNGRNLNSADFRSNRLTFSRPVSLKTPKDYRHSKLPNSFSKKQLVIEDCWSVTSKEEYKLKIPKKLRRFVTRPAIHFKHSKKI